MDNKIEVSVIVPMFNVGQYIKELINGLKINNCNFEALLINDGSVDDTLEQAKISVNNDKRFKIIEKEHSGVSTTRNLGLNIAVGDYILFCDGDDLILENAIDKLLDAAKQTKADLVYAGIKRFDGEKIWKTEGYEKYNVFTQGYKNILKNPELFHNIGPTTKLIHRKLLSNGIYFPENIHFAEDQVFTFNLYINAEKIYCTGEYIYLYRKRDIDTIFKSTNQNKNARAFEFFSNVIEVLKINKNTLLSNQNSFSDNEKIEILKNYYDRVFEFELYPLFVKVMKYDKIKAGEALKLLLDFLKNFDRIFINQFLAIRHYFLYILSTNLIPLRYFMEYKKLINWIYSQLYMDVKISCKKDWKKKKYINIWIIANSNFLFGFFYFCMYKLINKIKRRLFKLLAKN